LADQCANFSTYAAWLAPAASSVIGLDYRSIQQFGEEGSQIGLQGTSDLEELDYIDPAFASFYSDRNLKMPD
jgi:hypothetical protein